MEEKRREVGSPSPSPSPSATVSSSKNLDSPATEPPPPRRRGQKRKSTTSNASSAPPKRHAREKAAAAAAAASGGLFSSLLPPIHNGPLTRARQLSDNNAAIFSALNAVKNDHSMASANDSGASEGREEVKAANEEYKKIQAQIDAEVHAIRTRDSNVHVVPVAAGWFSWTNIHSIEKQTMRSFFNGKVESRTPEIYKEIRNWIMKRFHANPSTNIELNNLSELSIGDIDARQEILEFLDHWGLINYHPFPQDDPANVDADPNTDVEKEEKTDSLIEKLFQFENEQSSPELVPRSNMSTASVPSGLFPESIAEELVKQEGPAVEYHCNSCSADCSRKRYHCQKQADFDLCSECYNNGKFGSGMCPSDFILMEPAEVSGGTGGKWTDQETLLLLEALELYKENWNEIAEHVATKTKAQCILHFLQMPIEDSFLDYNDSKDNAPESGELTSINNEVPVPKDNSEPSEGGISKDNSGPAETVSRKDDSKLVETGSGKDDSELSARKSSIENPESLEKKTESNAAQPVSTQTETSNLEDAPERKAVDGKGDDVIIKALKEAFQVAGCPLTPEDKLSFAEAGNSVMALTAFLSQLVEPGLATVSARSSLKTISENPPKSQLAISHCFILEGPLDDEKEHVVSESMATEKNDQIAPEMAKEELINDKEIISTEEKSTSVLDGSHSTEGQIPKEEISRDDSQVSLGEQDKCSTKSGLPEKPDDDMAHVTEKPDEKSQLMEKPDEEIPQVTEKPDEEKASVTKKSGEEKCLVTEKCDGQNSLITEKHNEENSPVTDKPNEEKSSITVKPNEEKSLISKKPHEEKSQIPENTDKEKLMVGGKDGEVDSVEQVGTISVDEPHNSSLKNEQSHATTTKDQVTSGYEVMPPPALASESDNLKTAAVFQCMDVTKDTVMEPSCAVSDKTEQEMMAGEVAMVEASEAGEDKMEVDKRGESKSTKTAQMKDEGNVTKLKRAALATLSAAAVKSKLLANQEEDEIRQLATRLIEKQMRKLEVKLSYFSEMENAIMRVRDQLERSRQKLFNERAQIIASRLGIAPTSSRMLPSSYPVNRMPPGLLNSMLRPPMNMGAQRPLMSKPNVTLAPPAISMSVPPEVAGGSPTQLSAVEKPSSVGQTESLK